MLSHISQQMEEIKAKIVSSTCLYLFTNPKQSTQMNLNIPNIQSQWQIRTLNLQKITLQ